LRILSKYVLREFFRMFAVALTAFVLLFMLGDFIEKVDEYMSHSASAWTVVRYMLYRLPNTIFLMTPIAVLLATLMSIGMLSKNGEVLAMKSSGIPLYRIVAPVFTVAVALSLVIFWANDTVIPYCNMKAEFIKNVYIEKKPAIPVIKHDRIWFRGPKGEIINIGLVEFKGDMPVCRGVTFYELDSSFGLARRLDAKQMVWSGDKWVLEKGVSYDFRDPHGMKMARFDSLPVDIPEKPADFRQVRRFSEEMTFSELLAYISRLKAEGYSPVKYEVDLHGKVSFTLANIIMVIVAIPFSLKTSRSGGMAIGVGICIAIAISYWLLYSFSISLGHAGRFPPIFAAWVANLIFGFSGLYLFVHTDR